jgi:outer membrane protein OmpA-like peptidoglycan-associated protein
MRWLAMFVLLAGCAKAPVLAPVNFNTGTTELVNDKDQKAIDEAAAILEDSEWSVIVLGLADASGDADSNKALALARAEAVATQLRAKTKVPPKRIVVHSIGEKLATGTTVQERKVEFVFYKEKGLPVREVVEESGVLAEDFRRKAKE